MVDGHVNGVKGVYVKSVCPDGDGKRKGLQVGDCLICINDQSLFNRTRHDAVELVRNCDSEVHLEILRFPSITDVLSSSEHNSRKTSNTLGRIYWRFSFHLRNDMDNPIGLNFKCR